MIYSYLSLKYFKDRALKKRVQTYNKEKSNKMKEGRETKGSR
jgi:hypothetical protein